MASDADILPRRNLGPGEPWGRELERVVTLEERSQSADRASTRGLGRATAATLGSITRSLDFVRTRTEELRSGLLATPEMFSKVGFAAGFPTPEGWQEATAVILAPPPTKSRLEVTAVGRAFTFATVTATPGTGMRFEWPVPYELLNSWEEGGRFGDRSHVGLPYHNGVDFSTGGGYPIRAMGDGIVYLVHGWGGGTEGMDSLGNYVRIGHTGTSAGLMTGYAHLDAYPLVSEGEAVTRGQIIGYSGNTGFSFGAHLHLETWEAGERIDPLIWMDLYNEDDEPIESRASSMRSRIVIGTQESLTFEGMSGREGVTHLSVSGASLTGVTTPVRVSLQFFGPAPTATLNQATLTVLGAFI